MNTLDYSHPYATIKYMPNKKILVCREGYSTS
jgi:hypothetical protein